MSAQACFSCCLFFKQLHGKSKNTLGKIVCKYSFFFLVVFKKIKLISPQDFVLRALFVHNYKHYPTFLTLFPSPRPHPTTPARGRQGRKGRGHSNAFTHITTWYIGHTTEIQQNNNARRGRLWMGKEKKVLRMVLQMEQSPNPMDYCQLSIWVPKKTCKVCRPSYCSFHGLAVMEYVTQCKCSVYLIFWMTELQQVTPSPVLTYATVWNVNTVLWFSLKSGELNWILAAVVSPTFKTPSVSVSVFISGEAVTCLW